MTFDPNGDEEFRRERHVGIWAEPGIGPAVWDREGCAVLPEALPISSALRGRFENWWSWFEFTTIFTRNAAYRGKRIDGAEYAAEGRAIAAAIKRELPDWTVVFVDQHLRQTLPADTPFAAYTFEIGLTEND